MAEKVVRERKEKTGVLLVFIAVYISISLFSYNKWDPSPFTETSRDPSNYGGIIGAYMSDVLISFLGSASLLFPLLFLIYGIKRLIGNTGNRFVFGAVLLLIISSSMLISLIVETFDITLFFFYEGFLGSLLTHILKKLISPVGAYLVSLSLFYTSIILMTPLSISSFIKVIEVKERKEVTEKKAIAQKPEIVDKTVKEPVQLSIVANEHEDEPEELPPIPETREKNVKLPGFKEGRYIIPPLNLLSKGSSDEDVISNDELMSAADILHKKLSDFGVEGSLAQIHPGPVITMFEFEPAPGVKISKVVSISDDLGRAMGGIKVRVTLIPGKTPIGIEVPNTKRAVVYLREIIASDKFKKRGSLLTLSMGKDIYGNPIVEDLTKMPHLLVAGTTGSGKSVAVNSMIMSILYRAKPNEVKMLMIDPKLLELSIYEDIPHLIAPVITNPKEAAEALKKIVLEMERRYRLIAERGARNIDTFNVSVPDDEKLPYIVVIIDELADLMFTAAKNVEDSIVRLAQMARASGIHLILATQRPSVDVITGIIKANFPTRIAFQVSSKVDSRTIIDTHGAEKLLGRGDMLLLNPGTRLMRVHGTYVSEDEINAATDFIRSQGVPDYSVFDALSVEEFQTDDIPEDRDDLYKEVITYAETLGEVSISSIQRRFKIGYNRAARIMEMMAEDGLVGPQQGAGKARSFVSRLG